MSYTRNLVMDITYWAPTGQDTYGGKTFAAPVTLKGRWEDKMELVRSKTGSEIVSKSRAFVVQELDIDGYLYNGVSAAANPRSVDGASEIQALGRTSNLRNLQKITVAHL